MADKSKKSKRSKRDKKEKTFNRLDTVERVPSNAPTVAIAPSDYEHIFHEGHMPHARQEEKEREPPQAQPRPVPPALRVSSPPPLAPPTSPPPSPKQAPTITLPPAPLNLPKALTAGHEDPNQQPSQQIKFGDVLQVSPDGYTILGHQPEPSARRRALPSHIVRAGNQFSRAALLRIAQYLKSRADSG